MGDLQTYQTVQSNLRPMQGYRGGLTWNLGRHETGAVAYFQNPAAPNVALDATELFNTKEIWANDFYFLDPARDRTKELGFSFIPTGAVEEVFLDTLKSFIKIAHEHLRIESPVRIEAGLVGVQNYRLAVDQRFFGFNNFEGRIVRRVIKHEATMNDWATDPSDALLPLFESIYDAAGLKRPNTPVPTRMG
jgi:hypothetical protein